MFICTLLVTLVSSGAQVQTFDAYSDPIYLRPGEVHNAYVLPKLLPHEIRTRFANRTLHLKSMQLDIVRYDEGTKTEVQLPLFETYNHHHALLLGQHAALEQVYNYTHGRDPLNPGKACAMMKGSTVKALLKEVAEATGGQGEIAAFGGASGAEFRGTSTSLAAPYTYPVWNPDSFMVLMHFINTKGIPHDQKLWECPCTSARKIDVANGTIDGLKPMPFNCSAELKEEGNAACSLATYQGGYRCCENGVFLVEKPDLQAPADKVQAKFTFEYYVEGAAELAEGARRTVSPSCCDASAASVLSTGVDATASMPPRHHHRHKFGGNLEYDVPKCAAGIPPERCTHVISAVESFDMSADEDPNEEIELVHAWGHQHVAGLGLELYREATGELLCKSEPHYGSGSQAGDEAGFVVGIKPCVWGPGLAEPPRLRRSELVRTVAHYNSTEAHHGVMSLWILTASPVPAVAFDFVV